MTANVRRRGYEYSKRVFDIVASGAALVLLAPLMVVVAVAVHRTLSAPILFRQDRPGLRGHVFQLVKFRSMLEVDRARGLVSNDQRMTAFGSRLRAWSLDELPSLWNVLVGDMSLVGPRPLLVEYLPLYSDEHARRHDVRPGLTGLAQVNGRNALDWDARLALDVYYVDHRSWRLDAAVLAKTIGRVMSRDGIASEGEAAGVRFRGSDHEERASE